MIRRRGTPAFAGPCAGGRRAVCAPSATPWRCAGAGLTDRLPGDQRAAIECQHRHVEAGLPALPPLSLELLRASTVSRPPVERLAGLIIASLQQDAA